MNANVINGIDLSEHFGLIGAAVRNSRWAIGASLEWDDLFQAGYFGLRRAAEKFDAGRGCKFSTYAMPWIRATVRRAALNQRRTIRIPVWIHERRRTGLGQFPADGLSLDAPQSEDDGAGRPWVDLLTAVSDPAADTEAAKRRQLIEEALAELPERLRGILEARFWRDETLAEIGGRLGLSRERVRQLEAEGLKELRDILEEEP